MPYKVMTNRQQAQRSPDIRESAYQRGYGRRWQRLRQKYLQENPLCTECYKYSVMTPSREVHHIEPHNNNPELLFDEQNLMALCKSCHSKMTGQERRK